MKPVAMKKLSDRFGNLLKNRQQYGSDFWIDQNWIDDNLRTFLKFRQRLHFYDRIHMLQLREFLLMETKFDCDWKLTDSILLWYDRSDIQLKIFLLRDLGWQHY